jgi:hypothetical protein
MKRLSLFFLPLPHSCLVRSALIHCLLLQHYCPENHHLKTKIIFNHLHYAVLPSIKSITAFSIEILHLTTNLHSVFQEITLFEKILSLCSFAYTAKKHINKKVAFNE